MNTVFDIHQRDTYALVFLDGPEGRATLIQQGLCSLKQGDTMKLDRSDKNELKKMGEKAFIKQEKSDIAQAKKLNKKGGKK